MAELPNKCFAKQSKLKHLQMDFNQIANITNETFFGLKSLTHLSLRGNLLTSLNDELVSLTEVSSNKKVVWQISTLDPENTTKMQFDFFKGKWNFG